MPLTPPATTTCRRAGTSLRPRPINRWRSRKRQRRPSGRKPRRNERRRLPRPRSATSTKPNALTTVDRTAARTTRGASHSAARVVTRRSRTAWVPVRPHGPAAPTTKAVSVATLAPPPPVLPHRRPCRSERRSLTCRSAVTGEKTAVRRQRGARLKPAKTATSPFRTPRDSAAPATAPAPRTRAALGATAATRPCLRPRSTRGTTVASAPTWARTVARARLGASRKPVPRGMCPSRVHRERVRPRTRCASRSRAAAGVTAATRRERRKTSPRTTCPSVPSDWGDDCCAHSSWGEPQTCRDNYLPIPNARGRCTSSWPHCAPHEGGIGCYGCYPPGNKAIQDVNAAAGQHDGSKCSNANWDCCAHSSWGSRQTCSDGYVAVPNPPGSCTTPRDARQCALKDGGIGCYGCYPAHAAVASVYRDTTAQQHNQPAVVDKCRSKTDCNCNSNNADIAPKVWDAPGHCHEGTCYHGYTDDSRCADTKASQSYRELNDGSSRNIIGEHAWCYGGRVDSRCPLKTTPASATSGTSSSASTAHCGTRVWRSDTTAYVLGAPGSRECGACGGVVATYDACMDASRAGKTFLGINGLPARENWGGPSGCHIQERANFQWNDRTNGDGVSGHTPVCIHQGTTADSAGTSTDASSMIIHEADTESWNENGPYGAQGYRAPADVEGNAECRKSACEEYEKGRVDTDCCSTPSTAFCAAGHRYQAGTEGCGWGLVQGQRSTCCIPDTSYPAGSAGADLHTGTTANTANSLAASARSAIRGSGNPDAETKKMEDANFKTVDTATTAATVTFEVKQAVEGLSVGERLECVPAACREFKSSLADNDCCAIPRMAFCGPGHRYVPLVKTCGYDLILDLGQRTTCCVADLNAIYQQNGDSGKDWAMRLYEAGTFAQAAEPVSETDRTAVEAVAASVRSEAALGGAQPQSGVVGTIRTTEILPADVDVAALNESSDYKDAKATGLGLALLIERPHDSISVAVNVAGVLSRRRLLLAGPPDDSTTSNHRRLDAVTVETKFTVKSPVEGRGAALAAALNDTMSSSRVQAFTQEEAEKKNLMGGSYRMDAVSSVGVTTHGGAKTDCDTKLRTGYVPTAADLNPSQANPASTTSTGSTRYVTAGGRVVERDAPVGTSSSDESGGTGDTADDEGSAVVLLAIGGGLALFAFGVVLGSRFVTWGYAGKKETTVSGSEQERNFAPQAPPTNGDLATSQPQRTGLFPQPAMPNFAGFSLSQYQNNNQVAPTVQKNGMNYAGSSGQPYVSHAGMMQRQQQPTMQLQPMAPPAPPRRPVTTLPQQPMVITQAGATSQTVERKSKKKKNKENRDSSTDRDPRSSSRR
ncbi:unnamed protein product [Amoebophrya sp. A120]|nr:unnamed protein product [Amoebophrya sp. A120]|eukprot:GSA120T00001560001.1